MSDHIPLLTVALPVFNGGAILQRAVQSIVDQTFEDWELLIIDDGSTDGMTNMLPVTSDPRIRIIRDGQNKGLSVRLNQAIRSARGVYFARMDHDDICHPDRFAKQISYLKSHHEVDLLGAKCVTINEENQIVGVLPSKVSHDEICARPWIGFYVPHPTWCGKIEWFKKHLYKENPAPYCCEDQELLLRASNVSCYHVLPEYLLAYRIRTNTSIRRLWKNRWSWCCEQVKLFVKHGKYKYVLLAVVVTLLRIFADCGRKCLWLFGIHSVRCGHVDSKVQSFWERNIARATAYDKVDGGQ